MRDRRGGLALLCALLLAMIAFPAPARMVSSGAISPKPCAVSTNCDAVWRGCCAARNKRRPR